MKRNLTACERTMILNGAKEIFFMALLAGYASNKKTNGVPFVHGKYRLIDKWETNDFSDGSAGTTMILFDGQLIWWMSYGGAYPKEAISFLKEALAAAYKKSMFFGGRGPDRFERAGKFLYLNNFEGILFENFSGIERIFNEDAVEIGSHRYMGHALI